MRPLGYACVFLVLFAGFVGLDRVVDYFELLGLHQPLFRSTLVGGIWAAVMVSLLPLFVGVRTRR